MSESRSLEVRLRWLSSGMVVAFGLALAGGLLLHVLHAAAGPAERLLHGGLILLMLAPAVRLLVAVADRIRRRDYTFVAMTAVVILELAIVMWRAAQKL